MTPYYPGQEVVCIDANHDRVGQLHETWIPLQVGAIYTIREIQIADGSTYTTPAHEHCNIVLLLEGIIRPRGDWDSEPGYRATRFRPLIHTDISALEAILHTTPALEDA